VSGNAGLRRPPQTVTIDMQADNKERNPMAIHLTPTELARETGMERREVIARCMELGVPIFQGRIDKTLFLASLRHSQQRHEPAKA
jgi:hypothetical protein